MKTEAQPKSSVPVKLKDRITVTVESKAFGESGVARHEGFVVFVPLGVPGDTVEVEITEAKKKYATGKILKVLKASAARINPVCKIFGECGSCHWLNVRYEDQLAYKAKITRDTLSRFGGVDPALVQAMAASPHPMGYRRKAQQMVTQTDGRFQMGFYAYQSHRVVDCAGCPLQSDEMNAVMSVIRASCERLGVPIHLSALAPQKGGSGAPVAVKALGLRYLIVRSSQTFGHHLVILVVSQIDVKFRQVAEELMRANPRVKGVLLNVNPDETNVIVGPTSYPLAGAEELDEEVAGLKFKISPTAFFQANVEVAEMIVKDLQALARPKAVHALLEVYCGGGMMSLALASLANTVFGVDESGDAIFDAKRNADLNHIHNASFHVGPAEQVVPQLAKQDALDFVLLDPPRKGCDERVLAAVAHMEPSDIAYVSCNPMTLARDLQWLTQHGYRVERVQPYDMFPQTFHIESLTHLTRVDPKVRLGP